MGDWGIWAGAALLAAVLAAGGFLLGRSGLGRRTVVVPPGSGPEAVLAALAAGGVVLDLLPGPVGEPLGRCRPTALGPDGLSCELLDSALAPELRPGRSVTCFFAPVRQDGRKVNAFESVVAAREGDAALLVLRAPAELVSLPRRRHARKRVSDPRFVHVQLWLADASGSGLYFPEAAPHIWVDAYAGPGGGESAVTDISPGGLALTVRAGQVPQGLEPGSAVVLKCSLFQFKQKQFKPYWYAGLVRGISAPDGKTRRIAVGFTAVGAPDEAAPQGVRWIERIQNETPQGGSA